MVVDEEVSVIFCEVENDWFFGWCCDLEFVDWIVFELSVLVCCYSVNGYVECEGWE